MEVRDGIVLHKWEIIAVFYVYVTQSGLKRPFHVTRDMSSEREFRCCLHAYLSFIAEMKSNKDTRYKQTNCTPEYILDRIDICWDFENFAVSWYELDPHVHISKASSDTAPEGQDKSSLRLPKWHETFHLMYMKRLCITVSLAIA